MTLQDDGHREAAGQHEGPSRAHFGDSAGDASSASLLQVWQTGCCKVISCSSLLRHCSHVFLLHPQQAGLRQRSAWFLTNFAPCTGCSCGGPAAPDLLHAVRCSCLCCCMHCTPAHLPTCTVLNLLPCMLWHIHAQRCCILSAASACCSLPTDLHKSVCPSYLQLHAAPQRLIQSGHYASPSSVCAAHHWCWPW